MKNSLFSYNFFYLEKNVEVLLILLTVIISGSPSKEAAFLSLKNLDFPNDYSQKLFPTVLSIII
jgi:hypothetical protein